MMMMMMMMMMMVAMLMVLIVLITLLIALAMTDVHPSFRVNTYQMHRRHIQLGSWLGECTSVRAGLNMFTFFCFAGRVCRPVGPWLALGLPLNRQAIPTDMPTNRRAASRPSASVLCPRGTAVSPRR